MGTHRGVVVASSLLVAGLLVGAGCARPADQSAPGGTVSTSDMPVSPGPSLSPTGQLGATASKGALTVRGEVEEGVEPGCLVLKADDGKTYLLVGGDRPLIAGGGRLEVTGRLEPGLMTTCQQGTPFQVAQVRRI